MPTTCGHQDSKGTYCQWGGHGAHYYYTPGNKESMEAARKRADAQGAAAYAHGYGGKGGEEMSECSDCQIEEKKLPDIRPNEDEQTYVSRCIAFETEHSPDRPKEQIARMCYEKYRQRNKSEVLTKASGILNQLSDNLKKNLTPEYYSKSKPFYRFEIATLGEELKSANWDSKRVLVDIKCDGLRLSLGKINGKGFCYVDPEALKQKSPDVSNRLPGIIRDLETLPDNTVLDGEFIAVEGNEILHRTTANSILNATNFPPEKLESIARVFIFDVLYYEGRDIRNQPLHERLEYLGRIKSTDKLWVEKSTTNLDESADGYIVQASSLNENILNKVMDTTNRPKYIAEGAMIKTLDDPYETPINHGWGKLKRYYEVDGIVWDKKLVKGQTSVWNYFLGINRSKEDYDKLPNKYKVPDALLQKYGKSDNSKIECGINEVLRVASEEVLKSTENGVNIYRGYINRVLEPIPEKNVSDSLEVLDKLSSFQPKRIPMEEITRIENSEFDPALQIEEVNPSGSIKKQEEAGPSCTVPQNVTEINISGIRKCFNEESNEKLLSYKYPISIATIMELSEIARDEILEWVEKKRIPNKIYKELAKDNQALPKSLYVDQKTGKAWVQMHFRGIEEDVYNKIKNNEVPLWKGLIGQSVHMDLRIDYPGLEKLVQYVITENDVQSMLRMMKGEKRQTANGIMNVQHSEVVSKPSGEPPEGPEKFYKAEDIKEPSINEEGAKLADSIIIKEQSYWIEPGQIGSTKNTYSYMALIWLGSITTGCERHDLHELFMTKEKGEDNIFNGKFTIKCLKRPDSTARWEIWKASTDPTPMDPIMHSDIGYHYLAPEEKVDKYGREAYRDMSQNLYRSKLK